jgi:hypothetical protein
MADVQIFRGAKGDVPVEYELPASAEFILKAVNADFTDTGAAGDWLPCVTIVSDSGHVIARAVDQGVKVTAGSEAEVSWFPHVRHAPIAASGGGGAPDYIMMTGVATAIPSVFGGASGQVPWNHATFATNNAALWSFTLDGFGNIVQVITTQPGRYEAMAVFHFDAPAAAVDETFSLSIFGGGVTNPYNSAAIRTVNDYEGMVGGFDQHSAGQMFFETDYNFDVATTGLIRGQWWWIKRWAL